MILGAFNEYRASLDPPLLHRLLFENVARGLPNVAVSKQNAHSITPPLAAYSGLQYTDTAYVAALLFLLLPFSVISLFAVFAGNAKHVRFLFTAAYAAASSYCYALAIPVRGALIHIVKRSVKCKKRCRFLPCQNPPFATFFNSIGVPIALLVVVVTGILSAFYTEVFAWPVTSFWTVLVILTTVFQLLASLTPFKLGVLLLIPGYLTAPVSVQFVWQMCFFTLGTVFVFLFANYLTPSKSQWSVTWNNGQSSCIAAYFVVGGISYIMVLTGLTRFSCLDPVSLFATPSSLSLANPTHTILLLLWVMLTAIGWKVQARRDALLTQEPQYYPESSTKEESKSSRSSNTQHTSRLEPSFTSEEAHNLL